MISFGADGSAFMGRSTHFFVLASDRENHLWTVRRDATTVTLWNLAPKPTVVRAFDRDMAAFDRDNSGLSTSRVGIQARSWKDALNLGAMLDDDGLWIVGRAGDPAWTRPLERGEFGRIPPRLLFEGWVDLMDPETGRTITRLEHDGSLRWFANGSRYIIAYDETDAGVPWPHLLEPRLVR